MSGTLPLVAFVGAAALLTITPGVDTVLVLRTAAQRGTRAAGMAGLGIAGGCLAWGALVATGLAALLQAWPLAFTAMRLAGAAYLAWLGCGLLFAPRTSLGQSVGDTPVPSPWRQGLLTNLLNPKVGVFYLTFLPQFLPTGSAIGPAAFALVAIHVALSLCWFALLIAATLPLSHLLARPGVIAGLDRTCGAVFIGFAARLALANR